MSRKYFSNRDTGCSLNFMIGIVKRQAELYGQPLADRRFSGAHKADQNNALGRPRHFKFGLE